MPALEVPGLWTSAFLGILALVIAWVFVRSLSPRPEARTASPQPPTSTDRGLPPVARPGLPLPAIPEDALHRTARDLAARLDRRISLLESLLRDADQAAARLEAATAAANGASQGHKAPGCQNAGRLEGATATAKHAPEPPWPCDGSSSAHLAPLERPATSTDRLLGRLPGQAEGLKDAAAPAGPPGVEDRLPDSRPGTPRPPRYQPIHLLADQGCSAEEIARRTGIPLGEVQLVLKLHRAPAPAGAA